MRKAETRGFKNYASSQQKNLNFSEDFLFSISSSEGLS